MGSPSHLRYLVRRLRRWLPEVPILVGFWPDEAQILKDDRVRAAIGADYYTSSLHDAVEACLEAAYNSGETSRSNSRGAVINQVMGSRTGGGSIDPIADC
jgi:hypothetical protein